MLELLEKYCLQDENVMFERHRFYERRQGEGETTEKFITDLRTLARTCNFVEDGKDFTDQMIRDRLVCGISNDAVRQRLLAKENPTLAACIKECRTSETTASQVREIRCVVPHCVKLEPADDETRILRTTTAPPKRSGWERQTLECRYCNRRHEKGKCPAFGQVRRKCGKRNHFAAAC